MRKTGITVNVELLQKAALLETARLLGKVWPTRYRIDKRRKPVLKLNYES